MKVMHANAFFHPESFQELNLLTTFLINQISFAKYKIPRKKYDLQNRIWVYQMAFSAFHWQPLISSILAFRWMSATWGMHRN